MNRNITANWNAYQAAYRRNKREEEKTLLEIIERLRTKRTRKSYAEYLMNYHWDYFFTVTFRKARREPYYAMKAVLNVLGRHNMRRAFIGCEPHQSGDLHIHGILAGNNPGWYPELHLTWDIWEDLFKSFGRNKVELINSFEQVSMYCAKYVLKQQSRVCDYYTFYGEKKEWQGALIY